MRIPIPTLVEKKACPMARITTLGVIFEKSGWNRNFIPSSNPGKNIERMPKIISMRNSTGIMILAAFSIPLFTPRIMMKWLMNINKNIHIKGLIGVEMNWLNSALYSAAD